MPKDARSTQRTSSRARRSPARICRAERRCCSKSPCYWRRRPFRLPPPARPRLAPLVRQVSRRPAAASPEARRRPARRKELGKGREPRSSRRSPGGADECCSSCETNCHPAATVLHKKVNRAQSAVNCYSPCRAGAGIWSFHTLSYSIECLVNITFIFSRRFGERDHLAWLCPCGGPGPPRRSASSRGAGSAQ